MPPPADFGERVQRALAVKPTATRVGAVLLTGIRANFARDRIVVVRDGRDVLVHWTLRQLRSRGPVLQRFLANPEKDCRIGELVQRFTADPDDVLVRNRGLLLADYEWLRFGAYLWSEAMDDHFGALAWDSDHPSGERWPLTLHFDAARKDVRKTFDELCTWLELDPSLVPPFATEDPVAAASTDPVTLAEWEVGEWPRWFTKRASKLFKMDGGPGLDSLAQCTFDDSWEGECPPA